MEREQRVSIALQKSGRLSEDSLDLLKKCGLHVSKSKNELYCGVEGMPIDLLLIRDDDIPNFVNDGVCDLGIVGENVFMESKLGSKKDFNAEIAMSLGFSKCRLSLAVRENFEYKNLSSLKGLRVATSYPNLLSRYFADNKVSAEVINMKGSVEVAPRLKIADAICDIISTGATMSANGLKPVEDVLKSQALLIKRPGTIGELKSKIIELLIQRIKGVLKASTSKYIMLHAPKTSLAKISAILPGAEAPTVLELNSHPDKVAVHSVCSEDVFWETLEQLKNAGATSILVVPIEKTMY
jgi:ATP phosphoribosyltransferase